MKICFIDTWTVGLENLAPVHKELQKKGIDSFLIHTSSFDDEKYPEYEEIIKDVNCKEIRYYNTKLIHKALKKEMPDVVLNLTSFYILDRAINYSCKALGIKSVFLMPGTRETDLSYIKNEEYNFRFKQLNNQRMSRFQKSLHSPTMRQVTIIRMMRRRMRQQSIRQNYLVKLHSTKRSF